MINMTSNSHNKLLNIISEYLPKDFIFNLDNLNELLKPENYTSFFDEDI